MLCSGLFQHWVILNNIFLFFNILIVTVKFLIIKILGSLVKKFPYGFADNKAGYAAYLYT